MASQIRLKAYFSFTTVLSVFVSLSSFSVTEQWNVYETSFTSSKNYENPLQDVKVVVEFTSPNGEARTYKAFWNRENEWIVRFSPNETGEWTFKTTCTDQSNSGLHNQSGTFECVEYEGDNPLYKHGELRLSQNRRFMEYNDGTPYFFMADTVWCGPAFAQLDDWYTFLKDRVGKKFNAIQFVVAQWRMFSKDADGNVTFTGHDKIKINPKYFQRLDHYVNAINEKGLFAVPVVLWAIRGEENPGYSLPTDQRILLAEYIIARYGAHQVIWFLGGDGDYAGEKAEPWKEIGRAVIHDDQHRLTTMHVGGKKWVGSEFRREPWFDFISYQSGHGDHDDTFRFIFQGPPAYEWNKDPMLPVINTEPNYEAHNGYTHKKVHNDYTVRRACYWSLLSSPTAGVSYGGQGVWGWHNEVQAPADHISTGMGSPWYIAKDLPGTFSMMELYEFFDSIEWWRLEPAQNILMSQPGNGNPALFITAAKSDNSDTAVIYIPEGMEIKIKTADLNVKSAKWYHPRTGGWLDAGTVQKPEQSFTPADRNDWVLLLTNY